MTIQTSVNVPNPKTDPTVKIIDLFYAYEQNVPAEEYNVVYSFFLTVMNTKEAANNFTTALFRAASTSNTPVLTLLQTLQGQPPMELTATLAYYLNGQRSLSTLLGVGQIVLPNIYAARNVIQ
jgi:hypothetical protein